MTTTMDMDPYTAEVNMDLYDYNETVVPDAPEPMMNYSDINQ